MSKIKAQARIEILRGLLENENNSIREELIILAAIVADSIDNETHIEMINRIINRLKNEKTT